MRIGVKAGIRKLPYVFSFYCKEQTNKTPKYIDWFNLSYNASSKLLQGVIARDSDETKGVSLEVTAYGSDASKIYGPNFWAEAGAHDNLNTSGFVSLDCKTVPTAECGWLLNVPLQMEMPKDFNVSFGLTANNKYTLGEWAVFWSCDKSDWQEAGRIVILKPKAGGSNYWYFTVPVSLPAPLPAGSMLYIKLVPQGSDGTDGYKGADTARLAMCACIRQSSCHMSSRGILRCLPEPFISNLSTILLPEWIISSVTGSAGLRIIVPGRFHRGQRKRAVECPGLRSWSVQAMRKSASSTPKVPQAGQSM